MHFSFLASFVSPFFSAPNNFPLIKIRASNSRMSRSSDPENPFQGRTLFPNVRFTPDPSNPDDFHRELQAIDLHLRSTTASLPGIKEKAKNILNRTVPQSEISPALRRLSGLVSANAVENHRERRPALDRKRARFSLKPNVSQPDINLGAKFDSRKYKDPEEYFTFYERNERTMSSSSADEKAPLWKFVKKIRNYGSGGSYEWECNFCHRTYHGSYSRVEHHLLPQDGEKSKGIVKCEGMISEEAKTEIKLVRLSKERAVRASHKGQEASSSSRTTRSSQHLQELLHLQEENKRLLKDNARLSKLLEASSKENELLQRIDNVESGQ